jgi:hypothetical protein
MVLVSGHLAIRGLSRILAAVLANPEQTATDGFEQIRNDFASPASHRRTPGGR